eukprot:1168105-Ditylum_brightwellii.AAC.1
MPSSVAFGYDFVLEWQGLLDPVEMSDFQMQLYGVVLVFSGPVPEQNLLMPCQRKPLFFLGPDAVLL